MDLLRISLLFDRRVSYGSAEHYFHFIWGYLLPSIYLIENHHDKKAHQFIFISCGPIMDKLIREVMQLCKFNFEIMPTTSIQKDVNPIVVPRWDIYLLRPNLVDLNRGNYTQISNIVTKLQEYPDVLASVMTTNLSKCIVKVKSIIERHVNAGQSDQKKNPFFNSYLILARSEEPAFYSSESGQAEISGYGASRRALEGIEEARSALSKNDIPIEIFEPGKVDFSTQVSVFGDCRGVVGIKGAEFANLIWLKPQSLVILIKPVDMKTPPVQKNLADILNLKYIEVETDQGNYPKLAPEILLSKMSSL